MVYEVDGLVGWCQVQWVDVEVGDLVWWEQCEVVLVCDDVGDVVWQVEMWCYLYEIVQLEVYMWMQVCQGGQWVFMVQFRKGVVDFGGVEVDGVF